MAGPVIGGPLTQWNETQRNGGFRSTCERDLRTYVPPRPRDILEREGLRRAVAAVLELLESQEGARSREWQRLTLGELLDHADGHSAETRHDPGGRDAETGALHAAHDAVRRIMVLAKCIELDGGRGDGRLRPRSLAR